MKRSIPVLLAIATALALSMVASSTGWAQEAGWHETFEDGWEGRWRQRRLASRSTEFLAGTYDGNAVLRVHADRSAAVLIRPVSGGWTLATVSWRWLLDRPLVPGPDKTVVETDRAGDDYAARVFVIFGDDLTDNNTRALCYVWARDQEAGTVFPSPVADRVQTIVLRTGTDPERTWWTERINPTADYRRIFGTAPPPVGAIGLMSDADDTDLSATVLFDDIVVGTAETLEGPGR